MEGDGKSSLFRSACWAGAGESDKAPWQFTLVEADRELAAARTLAALGFYKDAFKLLRSFLELTLFGLFLLLRRDQEYFQQWFLGAKPIPAITGDSGVIRCLTQDRFLARVDPLTKWTNLASEQYKVLSNFVHGRGKEFSNLWLWQGSQARFNTQSWTLWMATATKTIELVMLPLVCYFPRALMPVSYFEKFGFDGPAYLYLDEEQVETVRAVFSPENFDAVKSVIVADQAMRQEAEQLSSWPDQGPEQIEATLARFIASVKNPEDRRRIEQILSDGQLAAARTAQWSALLNLQRKSLRDASINVMAQQLELMADPQSSE